MANISTWEKLRNALGFGYSDKLVTEIAREKAELEAQRKAARDRILAQQAAAKAAEEAYAKAKAAKATSAGTGKVASGDVKKAAPKKAAPKKQAEPKAKPAAKATPKKK